MSELVRDRTLLKRLLKPVGEGLCTTEDCVIRIPYNYLKYKLAEISDKTLILAVAVVICGNKYGVLNGCCKIQITPAYTKQVVVDKVEYLEFGFNAGDILSPTNLFVKDSDLISSMYKYFNTMGRIPWFLEQDDHGRLYTHHREYGGLNISINNIPFETVTSMIYRDADDKFIQYRHTDQTKKPATVPFSSVLFNATSTTSKILGSNLGDGFLSAIANPSDVATDIEAIMRY